MKKWDFLPGMVWMGLGIIIIIGSLQLNIGSFKNPGPGLFPLIIGVALVGCSISIVISSVLIFGAKGSMEEISETQGKINLIKVVLVLIYLIVYAFLLEKIGYILTTFIIFLLMFKTMGSIKLRTILLILFLIVGISYFAFVKLLETPLPSGIWRIGY